MLALAKVWLVLDKLKLTGLAKTGLKPITLLAPTSGVAKAAVMV